MPAHAHTYDGCRTHSLPVEKVCERLKKKDSQICGLVYGASHTHSFIVFPCTIDWVCARTLLVPSKQVSFSLVSDHSHQHAN